MNELHFETSPYLLQHAGNPIHWKAWNSSTLEQARRQNKLIIVSVGYSACHWCHVMEHESFEDEEVAEVMNEHYVSIKVDREERPDIDALYMKAVQLMSGHGGWPMNAVLLPDGRPIWGGTYFRKNDWINSLKQLQELYAENPAKAEDYAEKLMEGISTLNPIVTEEPAALPATEAMAPLIDKWKKSFDTEFGGHARAPKFMMPGMLLFLQRYGFQKQDKDILDFTDLTLTRMAWGGIFDTVGGGFSRYSVDMHWHVPHFEKMLYDNGQLMSLYAEAYKRTANPLYKEIIEKVHFFISRELTNENGSFMSALDADSLNTAGHLEEGAYYVWEKQELKDLLKEEFELFSKVFNVNEFGFWENGNYVLIQAVPLSEIAARKGISEDALRERKTNWEKVLLMVRQQRPRPRLDNKVLASWNALMLKGYTDAYMALGDTHYLDAALKNATFLTDTLMEADGRIWRTKKEGFAGIEGFLDDYALTSQALLSLHRASADEKWAMKARQLADFALAHFYERGNLFFRFTSAGGEQLAAPHFETEDNVIPASNSVMGQVLYELGILFGEPYYEDTARKMLEYLVPFMDYPSAYYNWLALWLDFDPAQQELAVLAEDAAEQLSEINRHYLPGVTIAGGNGDSSLPFLQGRFVKNEVKFYVCKNKACDLPVDAAEEALQRLATNNNG